MRRLPFVADVKVTGSQVTVVVQDRTRFRFHTLRKAGSLGYAVANQVVNANQKADPPLLLVADHISRDLGQHLADHQVSFIDAAGNCHIDLGGRFHALIVGRRSEQKPPRRQDFRTPGYQVVFAILADSLLLQAPVRQIASQAGVSKTVVAEVLRALDEDLLIGREGRQRRVLDRATLLDSWLRAYERIVRRSWLIGRFTLRERDATEIEDKIAAALNGMTWGFGGTAAAMRLAPHYRAAETSVHLLEDDPDVAKRLRAIPNHREGNIWLFRTDCPVAFRSPVENTVHPLLVYTELVSMEDDRAREAAAELDRVQQVVKGR